MAEGRAKGRAEGELKTLSILQEFVDEGIITMEQAAQRFGVAVTRLEELFTNLKKV